MNDRVGASTEDAVETGIGTVTRVSSKGGRFWGDVKTDERVFKFHSDRRRAGQDLMRYPFPGEQIFIQPELMGQEFVAGEWAYATEMPFPKVRDMHYGMLREFQTRRGFGFVPSGRGDVLVHIRVARRIVYQPVSRIPQFTNQKVSVDEIRRDTIIVYRLEENQSNLRAVSWGVYDPPK